MQVAVPIGPCARHVWLVLCHYTQLFWKACQEDRDVNDDSAAWPEAEDMDVEELDLRSLRHCVEGLV